MDFWLPQKIANIWKYHFTLTEILYEILFLEKENRWLHVIHYISIVHLCMDQLLNGWLAKLPTFQITGIAKVHLGMEGGEVTKHQQENLSKLKTVKWHQLVPFSVYYRQNSEIHGQPY